MSDTAIHEFKVQIPQEEVDRLYRKLKDTRLPPREVVPGAGDKYGRRIGFETSASLSRPNADSL